MSAFAPVTLVNYAAANVVFSPLNIDSSTGVASWATSDSNYDEKSFMTVSTKPPSAKSPKARVKAKLTIPIMDVIDPTKKADEAIGTFEFAYPKNMSVGQRQDLQAYVASLAPHAIIDAFVNSFEGIY